MDIDNAKRITLDESQRICNLYKYFEIHYLKIINDFIFNNTTNFNIDNPVKVGHISSGTYVIKHCKTGRIYVGSTKDINERIYENRRKLKKNYHKNKTFQEAYNDSDILQIYFILTNSREEAFDLEQWLLDRYWDSGILFNIAKDARKSANGAIRTPETLDKMHKVSLGRKRSIESIEKTRLSHIGRKCSEETLVKMRAWTRTDEMKKKIGLKNKIALTGKKIDPKIAKLNAERLAVSRELQKKAVLINNIKYESVSFASNSLKIGKATVIYRLKSKYFTEWNYL